MQITNPQPGPLTHNAHNAPQKSVGHLSEILKEKSCLPKIFPLGRNEIYGSPGAVGLHILESCTIDSTNRE